MSIVAVGKKKQTELFFAVTKSILFTCLDRARNTVYNYFFR